MESGRRDQASDSQHADDQDDDEDEDGQADLAPRARDRVPDFLIQVEPIRLRFANHGPITEPKQHQVVMGMELVEGLGGRRRHGASLLEAPHHLAFVPENRDHADDSDTNRGWRWHLTSDGEWIV